MRMGMTTMAMGSGGGVDGLLPETKAYITRVLTTDADEITDISLTNSIIKNMKDYNIYANCLFYADTKAGIRKRTELGIDYVVTAYDMSSKISDVSQSADSYQPVISTDGILFDGIDDLIQKSFIDAEDGNARFPVTNKLTICAWFYLNPNIGNFGRIIGVEGAWIADVFPVNKSIGWFGSGVDSPFSSTNRSGSWHFMAITFDGGLPAENIKLYIDNSQTPNGLLNKTGNLTAVNTTPFTIGNRADGLRGWKDKLDHIAVFNSVLSADTLTSIYNLVKSRYGR